MEEAVKEFLDRNDITGSGVIYTDLHSQHQKSGRNFGLTKSQALLPKEVH